MCYIGILHACGDVSASDELAGAKYKYSPRMWRCFYGYLHLQYIRGVFSTHVEMFPHTLSSQGKPSSILHACGDVSPLRFSRQSL